MNFKAIEALMIHCDYRETPNKKIKNLISICIKEASCGTINL